MSNPDREPKRPDEDRYLIAGCATMSGVSVFGLGLLMLPFFLFQTNELRPMLMALGIGMAMWLVLGITACRLASHSGAVALVGSGLCFGAFFLMRHLPMASVAPAASAPVMEYPVLWVYLVPVVVLVVSLMAAALAVPPNKPTS